MYPAHIRQSVVIIGVDFGGQPGARSPHSWETPTMHLPWQMAL